MGGGRPYDELASVYDWLVPDDLLTPEGSAAAFSMVADELRPGARVLDCAAGTGQLAVGLALRGFDVTATDASGGMVERTRALAGAHGVAQRDARGRSSARTGGPPPSTPSSASATRSRTRPAGPPGAPRSPPWRRCSARTACSR